MKEQGKNLQDQIHEEEIGNLPEKEFRVMIVKMLNIANYQRNANQNYNEVLSHTNQNGIIKKSTKNK